MIIEEVKRVPDKDSQDDSSTFNGLAEYRVSGLEDEPIEGGKVFVQYGFSRKYGARRRHITVYREKSKPLARLVGADGWGQSQRVLWQIPKMEGRGLLTDLRNLPEELSDFPTVRFRKRVTGPRASACWSIEVPEKDIESLISLGLIREHLDSN